MRPTTKTKEKTAATPKAAMDKANQYAASRRAIARSSVGATRGNKSDTGNYTNFRWNKKRIVHAAALHNEEFVPHTNKLPTARADGFGKLRSNYASSISSSRVKWGVLPARRQLLSQAFARAKAADQEFGSVKMA